jgi:hypothetical protein
LIQIGAGSRKARIAPKNKKIKEFLTLGRNLYWRFERKHIVSYVGT